MMEIVVVFWRDFQFRLASWCSWEKARRRRNISHDDVMPPVAIVGLHEGLRYKIECLTKNLYMKGLSLLALLRSETNSETSRGFSATVERRNMPS